MAFRGWPSEALEFYEGLEADNSKTYWMAHKTTYDEMVLAPMTELLAEIEPDFGPAKIFRPYRDVRFSADKSPYKTSIAASLERGGYIQLTANGLGAGSGMWMMSPQQLAAYRAAVDDETSGTDLLAVIADLDRQKIEASGHDRLAGAPRGYPKDHPRIELLRNKGLVAWRQWPVASWLGTATAKKRVVEFLHATQSLDAWLAEHVGA